MNAVTEDRDEKLQKSLAALEVRKAGLVARDDLIAFTQFMRPDPNNAGSVAHSTYTVKQHHRVLAGALMDAESGKLWAQGYKILAISVGPQKGKSELTSRMFPAYAIGRRPERNIMLGSYNQDFANEFGDDVRTILSTKRYGLVFPATQLRKGSKAKDHMVTEHNGKLSFLGRGGSGTGRPADIFIIDDPLKDQQEAASLVIRDQCWFWFTRVVMTRTHGLSIIVIVSTRWSEDDLIGRLTDKTNHYYDEEMAKQVCYVNLPSIVDDPELAGVLQIPVGGSIWEERFPLAMLQLRRRVDALGFDAMEMGRPTPPEGAFFKRAGIKTYGSPTALPKDLRYYGSADLAVTPERKADSSVILNAGVDGKGELWIHWDILWEKIAADASVDKLIMFCKQFGWFEFFGEKGQISNAVGPFLTKQAQVDGATALTSPHLFPTTGNKGNRAQSIRGWMTKGAVHFPSFAPWWPRALDCLLKFTGSGDDKEDDFPDALALLGQGLNAQLRASDPAAPKDNVIRVGSLAWIKHAHNQERARETRHHNLRGQ